MSQPVSDMPLTMEEVAAMAPDMPGPRPQGLGARHALDHTEEDGYADLMLCALTCLCADLQDNNVRIRRQAIWDAEQGGANWMIETLPISEDARQRVYDLIGNLVRCAKIPR